MGWGQAYVTLKIVSNVPGTDDLEVATIRAYEGALSLLRVIDISLENALTYKKATVEVYVKTVLNEVYGRDKCLSVCWALVGDFRIVATR